MMDSLKQTGTMPWLSYELKISVNICASWSTQALMTPLAMPSSPAAFLGLTFLKVLLTSPLADVHELRKKLDTTVIQLAMLA